ncbi:hypothetical protein ACFOJE_19340 [Azotobacter bryophylli]|uniref:Uncharacterized protein n=1 Tax=Azotobacter bryophylli TaxID=1986537 RepID=A0ABV7B0S0_9GAMM
MKANQFLGLLKFFHNPEFMEKLLSGFMHCQTPEVYRLAAQEGRGDKFESCVMSWRKDRGDAAGGIEFTINDHLIPANDLHSITLQDQDGDSWLSCWFTLRLPEKEADLERLKQDLTRLKQEFGKHFVFIPAPSTRTFLERLKAASPKPMWAQEITYEENSVLWSARCKSPAYSYQREFRIGFGQCEVHETEPYTFQVEGGLKDLMYSNVSLQLNHVQTGEIFFELLDL